ncbi:Lrp/AsnC family transcriptional regulator [Candidatus Woesearchaeota archaeon]|nr:Lrp/AsnC family transcriptional regulator [Candidatus Woesearchaeota archaeon]
MIDETDLKIIEILKQDSSLSTHQITKKIQIPQTTVLNRIRKLQEANIIEKFTIKLNHKQLGKTQKAVIFVKVDTRTERSTEKRVGDIEEKIAKDERVLNIKRLMGRYDFVIELACTSIDDLNDFLINKVRSKECIAETETMMVLKEWNNN